MDADPPEKRGRPERSGEALGKAGLLSAKR
jgi:hypothetical protein